MKINFILFPIAIMTYVLPNPALSQQISDTVVAKLDAQRDAKDDVNELLWTFVGLIGVPSCIVGGFYTGCSIGDSFTNVSSEGRQFPPEVVMRSACIGASIGLVVPFIPISMYKASPPLKRLIGKSPEYILSYTKHYKSKVRQIRLISSAKGATFGCFFLFLRLIAS